jgi:hypothetical protein
LTEETAMNRAIRSVTLFAALATGALLAPGCGTNSDCNITPDVASHPNSCTLRPQSTVTVNARWCSCNATTTCDVVDAGGGVFQLEPKVASCDASCEPNPTSCATDSVQCVFTTPGEGDYFLYFISGSGSETVPLHVDGSSVNTTCS